VIDSSELAKCLPKLGLSKCGQAALKRKGTAYSYKSTFYKAFSYAILHNKCGKSSSSSAVSAQKAWKICDASAGGVISSSEFRNCLHKLGLSKCGQSALRKKGTTYNYKSNFYKAYAFALTHNKCSKSSSSSAFSAKSAWAICDASNGGVIDSTEFGKCLPKLGLSRCGQAALKKKGKYYSNKSTFRRAFAYALAHNKCGNVKNTKPAPPTVSSNKAWVICDATKGGRVSPSEWRKCGKKLFSSCTLKHNSGYIRNAFRKFKSSGTAGLTKA
jgi:hypothetical protein